MVSGVGRRGEERRGPLAALLFFGGTLFPAIGFLNVYPFRFSFVADHFQYLASLGPIVLFAAATSRVLVLIHRSNAGRQDYGTTDHCPLTVDQPRRSTPHDPCLVFQRFSCFLLLTLACLTWHESGRFADVETLWRTTLGSNPNAFIAHDNLGIILLDRGQVEEAEAHFREAVEIEPRDAEGYANLGYAALKKGQTADAIPLFRKALSIQPYNAAANINIGTALLQSGQVDETVIHFQRALQVQPYNPMVLNNLARVRATSPQVRIRNGVEAVALAERACALTSDREPVVLETLACAYAETGQFEKAAAAAERAAGLALTRGWTQMAAKAREKQMLFRSRQPYRDPGMGAS
jgi:tetratricopeptide (TPR) repeat protein